jgi:hypothetical protein
VSDGYIETDNLDLEQNLKNLYPSLNEGSPYADALGQLHQPDRMKLAESEGNERSCSWISPVRLIRAAWEKDAAYVLKTSVNSAQQLRWPSVES